MKSNNLYRSEHIHKAIQGSITNRPTCIFTMGQMNKRLSKHKHSDDLACFKNSYIQADTSIVTVEGNDTMSAS